MYTDMLWLVNQSRTEFC